MNISAKYLTPVLTIVLIGLGAFQATLADGVTAQEAWQLTALIVGAVVTYFAPVLPGAWPAALKVAGAVVGAAIAALIPLLGGVWDASAITIVVLAALNAFAAQTGTDARVDSAKAALVNPAVPDDAAKAVDPAATKIALNQLANGS